MSPLCFSNYTRHPGEGWEPVLIIKLTLRENLLLSTGSRVVARDDDVDSYMFVFSIEEAERKFKGGG